MTRPKSIAPARSKKTTERIVEQLKLVETDPITGGERVRSHIVKSRLPSEPPFVKLYIEDLSRLLDITDAPKRLLLLLVERLDFDGFISLTPAARKRMCERLGIRPQTFANYMQQLLKSDILRSAGRGEYCVNPNYFARGDWGQIAQLREAYAAGLELRIAYTPDGRREVRAVQRSVDPQLPLFEEVAPAPVTHVTTTREHDGRAAFHDFIRETPEEDPRRKWRAAK